MNLDRHIVHGKDVPYIDFDAVVGRNSTFINLTEEQLEVLGGAEYIALKFLLKVVAGVSICLWNSLVMNDLPFLVLHQSSPDRLGIHYAVFCGTQMGHTLQLAVAAGVTNLVLIFFASQVTLLNQWTGHLYFS